MTPQQTRKARYKSDPAYRAHRISQAKATQQKHASDPIWVAMIAARKAVHQLRSRYDKRIQHKCQCHDCAIAAGIFKRLERAIKRRDDIQAQWKAGKSK